MQNEEMTLRHFTALVAPMLEKNKLNAIGNGLIVTAMHDKEKNFKKWFAGKECTFVHPYTGNRIEIRIGRDIEAIYYFLRYGGFMYVSLWHSGDDYYIDNKNEFEHRLADQGLTMGGM